MKVKGEITVFLSLIFVLLLSFILSIIDSASVQTLKNETRLQADKAVFSAFGEYQKELLEEYDVFGLEASYETGVYEEAKILNRMAYYGSPDLWQEITDIQLLTDNHGQAFREQVLAFMEQKTGLTLLKDITDTAAQWEEKEIEGREESDQLDQMLGENIDLLPEEADSLLEAKEGGILSLVLPKTFLLSGKAVQKDAQVSCRVRNTGRGSFPEQVQADGTVGKLALIVYISEHFGNAAETKGEDRSLDYEMEYLLEGKEQDAENLKTVLSKILFFRMAMNQIYLLTDSQKISEAEAMALALSAVILQPEAKDLIKGLLLVLWGFGESVVDIRGLLSGQKVPVAKNKETWQLSLGSLFSFITDQNGWTGTDSESGLDYGQYLLAMMLLEDTDSLTMRTLDRVEQNLIFEKGLSFFRADSCVTKIKVENQADLPRGLTYTFPLYYGYL